VSAVLIDGPTGVLQAHWHAHEQARAVAVLAHPHPLYGGTMDNKVITTLAKAFGELGAAVLRFNFRGTGKSEGQHDHGRGEIDDLAAAVDFARAQAPGLPLWLGGFSFGAFVSVEAANQLQTAKLLSIAPPAGKWSFSPEHTPSMPWLVIQGDQDEVIDAQGVYRWLEGLAKPPKLIRMEQASHFFHGLLVDLRHHINAEWESL
jgi:hypothetical protein